MKLIDQLKCMHSLAPSERAIRNYIIDHPLRFVTLTKQELLNELNTSTSTLYRFCNKVSAQSFDQMRLGLAQELLKNTTSRNGNAPNVNFPFTLTDSQETVAANISHLYQFSVEETFNRLDFRDFTKIVQMLKKAEDICLFTTNSNTLFAERFSNQLKEIGKRVRISSSPYKWKLETVDLNEKDVLIINSYAGRSSKYFLPLLQDLHQRKIPIILLGSTHNASFIPHAHSHLMMCDLEDPKDKLYSFSTDVSTAYLFDLLFAALYQVNYEDNLKKRRYIYD